MISEDWKALFESHIHVRGRSYYHNGYVTKLNCTQDWIHAVVLGPEAYPGGQAVIDSLLTLWQETYPRRSAMLDEMRKARKEKVI